MATQDDEIITAANRATALTALASGEQKSAGNCLPADEMAALVAGRLGKAERQRCLDHLAGCQSCYDQWRGLAIDEGAANKIIKGPWLRHSTLALTAAGSLLAAAASLMLYLNLSPPPVLQAPAPTPLAMESASQPERAMEEVQSSAEQTLSLPKASRPEPALMSVPEARKRELAADMAREDLQAQAPAEQTRTQQNGWQPTREAMKKEVLADREADAVASSEREYESARANKVGSAYVQEEKRARAALAVQAEGDEEMVDIGNVIAVVVKKMAGLDQGQSLVLQTYKRDRSLTLVRLAGDRVLIREEGFSQEEFEVESAKLAKVLKSLVKKEFPRSNKVRLSGGRADQ